jgi:hypothetical protein
MYLLTGKTSEVASASLVGAQHAADRPETARRSSGENGLHDGELNRVLPRPYGVLLAVERSKQWYRVANTMGNVRLY